MKFKRIGILTFLLMMLIPVSAFAEKISTPVPHDYRNGLLDDENIIKSTELNNNHYDNDISTEMSLTVNRSLETQFNYPVNLKGFYISYRYSYSGSSRIYSNYFSDESGSLENLEIKVPASGYHDINIDNVVSIEINRSGADGAVYLREVDFFGSYEITEEPEPLLPNNIKNIDHTVTYNSAEFFYDLPTAEDFSHVEIYANGKVYETSNGNFMIDGLESDTEYEVDFITVDLYDNKSTGVTVTVRTDKEPEVPEDPVPKDVKNLEINASYDRVDLYWENPETQYFEMAKIYRKEVEQQQSSFNWNPFAITVAHASEDFKPIFETNGTYFADLSIAPETDYEYKVTTTYQGLESTGITITTAVPKAPIIDLDKIETPFDVKDLLTTGNGLLLLVGGFVLLGLAFLFVPRIINLIVGAFAKSPGEGSKQIKEGRQPRESRQMSIQPRQPREQRTTTRQPRQPRESRA